MLQSTKSKILVKRPYRFILGLAVGVTIGAVLLSLFSIIDRNNQLSIGGAIVSGMTYCGFGLALFGYFYKKAGSRNFTADFLLGVGIGLILVWFVEAGNGSIPANGILF